MVSAKKQKILIFDGRNWSKSKLKIGPNMFRIEIGPIFNFENVFLLLFLFWGKVFSFCSENEIFKNRRKRNKNVDQFLILKRANVGPIFHFTAYILTPSQNGLLFVYFDVHYDKLHKTQYFLRSMHITRNTIEDCAGNGSWKCATESKLPGSKDLESLGETRIKKYKQNKKRRKRTTNIKRGRRQEKKT